MTAPRRRTLRPERTRPVPTGRPEPTPLPVATGEPERSPLPVPTGRPGAAARAVADQGAGRAAAGRTARRWGRLTVLAVLLVSWAAAAAGPARAQTAPGTGSAGGGSLMPSVIPASPCQPAGPGAAATGGAATYPLSSYTIDYDEGGFTAISRKAVGTLTEMVFATVRWLVGVGDWLVGWAFSFGVANRLAAPMAGVAGRYQSAFFVPLLGFALLLSAAYGAVQIFRGRIGRGVGEFVLSLLLVTVFATWLLSNPQGFLSAAFRLTAQLSGTVASVALPPGPAGCSAPAGSYALPRLGAAVAPLTGQIENAFVRQPYELLEWGTAVPPACRPEADAVLAAGPGGDRDQIVAVMDAPPCAALYAFNRQPSTDRLGVAVLVLAASAFLMVSLGLVAGSVVLAQVVAVLLIGVMPFAALAAALPGAGRVLMWHWATAFARALGTVVAMSAFLTFLLLAGDALLQTGQGQSLLVQMATLNLVALLGFSLRRQLLSSGRRAVDRAGRRFEAARPGVAALPAGPGPGLPPGSPRSAGAGSLLDPAGGPGILLADRVAAAVGAARDGP
jgi:hypothetical protein